MLFIFVHFPSVCSTDEHNTTQQHTHTAHNIHNAQPHTAYNTHNTQHITLYHITPHHILHLFGAHFGGHGVCFRPGRRGRDVWFFNEGEEGTLFGLFRFFFVSWSRISVGLRGFRPCGGECLDPKDRERCLTRTNFRGGSQRYWRAHRSLHSGQQLVPSEVSDRIGGFQQISPNQRDELQTGTIQCSLLANLGHSW